MVAQMTEKPQASEPTPLYEQIKAIEFFEQSAVILPKTSLEEFQKACEYVAVIQRAVNWWIADLALAVERQHPQYHHQAWPEWMSPDLISRCKPTGAAYAPEDRNILATWTTHTNLLKRPDRIEAVQATVDAGQTSDEVRRNPPPPQERRKPVEDPKHEDSPAETQKPASTAARATTPDPATPAANPDPQTQKESAGSAKSNAWLLAVDMNYFIHRYFHSGAGMESATTFVQWLVRTITRLVETKGLTDVVCCVDSHTNHRKTLTEGWEHPYKQRSEKEPELADQLKQAPRMLTELNLPVVSIMDMEADDVMASYSRQFDGRVTLLTQDKDMRQCLSQTCNILMDVTWEEHPETGKQVPVYKWVSAKSHIEEGLTYNGTKVVGITPEQWPHFQAIAGDPTDGIRGCEGIGGKGAMDLIIAHGTVQAVIAACKDNQADLSAKKRLAVLDFEEKSEVMLLLTTLRTDLQVPQITKLNMRAPGT